MFNLDDFRSDDAFLILSDMEGVSGLIDDRLLSGSFWKCYGRYLLTEDVNTVASAIFSKGIRRIYLSESHNFGRNVVLEYLLPFIKVLPPHSAQTNIYGISFWEEFYGREKILGAIIIGFPAREESGGFLSHSWDKKFFKYIKVNGRECGAIGLTVGLLGHYKIPLIAVIGDEAAAREAEELIPEIITVTVKRVERDKWISVLPLNIARPLIFKKTLEALDKLQSIKPFQFEEPVDFIFAVKRKDYLHAINGMKGILVENETVRIKTASYIDAYDLFWKCYMKMFFGLH